MVQTCFALIRLNRINILLNFETNSLIGIQMDLVNKIHLAILASGSGSNAENFIRYFEGHPRIGVALVVSNNPGAHVLERAKKAGICHTVITARQWRDKEAVCDVFNGYLVDAVVLAGYLLLLPAWFVEMFPGKIFNIHPALLPSFGGKGMYGEHVHRAVINSGVNESGISIHLVNEAYDEGQVIFQKSLRVFPHDTADSLAKRIQQLEHRYYPEVVEQYLTNMLLSKEKRE